MSDPIVEKNELANENPEVQDTENTAPAETVAEETTPAETVEENTAPAETVAENTEAPSIPAESNVPAASKKTLDKKQIRIIAIAAAAVVLILLVILVPSKFERVKDKCVHIAGMVSGSGDYFTIDTSPDIYNNMDSAVRAILLRDAQDKALEAIKYANDELGFNGSVYSQMMNTTALMGRQSADNGKYRVSWTYHPDDGLEVTYEKK
jgi:hypothetical protein